MNRYFYYLQSNRTPYLYILMMERIWPAIQPLPGMMLYLLVILNIFYNILIHTTSYNYLVNEAELTINPYQSRREAKYEKKKKMDRQRKALQKTKARCKTIGPDIQPLL